MKKTSGWAVAASVIAMLLLLVGLLLTCFMRTVFDRSFVDREMQKYGVAESIGMDQKSLMELYDELLKYLEGRRDNLDITVTRYGVEQPAFHEKELLHMVDVEVLFHKCLLIRNIGVPVGLLLVLAVMLIRHKNPDGSVSSNREALRKGFRWATGIFFGAVAVLAIAIIVDFDDAFILFHRLLFTNDLWQLNYNTDLLMNIVPEKFSHDVALRTVVYFAIAFTALVGLIGIHWKKTEKKNKVNTA